jgi:methionine sulfoxide reductase heme-binding subunit
MNPHFWWYVARGAGFTSWLFGATSVATGLLMSSKATMRPRPNWQLDLHRHQGSITLSMLALHLGALVADNYSHFSLADLTLPMVSSWKPLAVAWGIVAMYLLITVQVTSLLRKRLSQKVWHTIHLSSLVAYVLTTAHFLQAGTDHRRFPILVLIVAVSAINVSLLSFRLLASPRSRRDASGGGARPTPSTARGNAARMTRTATMVVADPGACNDVLP